MGLLGSYPSCSQEWKGLCPVLWCGVEAVREQD